MRAARRVHRLLLTQTTKTCHSPRIKRLGARGCARACVMRKRPTSHVAKPEHAAVGGRKTYRASQQAAQIVSFVFERERAQRRSCVQICCACRLTCPLLLLALVSSLSRGVPTRTCTARQSH